MAGQNIIRIAAVALGLSTLSFAAGVAGDLSIIDPPRSGQRVVLRIPPEIPADAPRARALLSTASAAATPVGDAQRARREHLRNLVQSVQTAHEAGFELTSTGFDEQKPQLEVHRKPKADAPSEPRETKLA